MPREFSGGADQSQLGGSQKDLFKKVKSEVDLEEQVGFQWVGMQMDEKYFQWRQSFETPGLESKGHL